MAKMSDFCDFEALIAESKKMQEEKEEARNLDDDLKAFKAAMGE